MVWPKGKPRSIATKQKIRLGLEQARISGLNPGWPKGRKQSAKHRHKNSQGVLAAIARGCDIGGGKKMRGRSKSPEAIEAVRQALLKTFANPDQRRKKSQRQKEHLANKANDNCLCAPHRILRGDIPQSHLSERMAAKYLEDFPHVILEKKFGWAVVDAYLPSPYHLAFEADGTYWHQLKERQDPGCEKRRDKYLLQIHNLPVVHLTEEEINDIL